jgi:hypothetical protein
LQGIKVFRLFTAGVYMVVNGKMDEEMQITIASPVVEYLVDVPFMDFIDK